MSSVKASVLISVSLMFMYSSPGLGQEKTVTIRYGYILGISDAPKYLSWERRIIEKELEPHKIEWIPFDGSGKVLAAAMAKSIDMGDAAMPPIILARARGMKVKAIVNQSMAIPPAYRLFGLARKESNFKTIQDTKGKIFAVNDLGSSANWYLRYYLMRNNIDPDKDVKIIPLSFPRMAVLLVNKEIDVAIGTAMTMVALEGRVEYQSIFHDTDMSGIVPQLQGVYFANDDFIKGHSDVILKFVRGFIKAWDQVVARPDESIMIMAKQLKLPEENVRKVWPYFDFYGKEKRFGLKAAELSIPSVTNDIKIMRTLKIIDKDISIEDVADMSFVEKAHMELR